MEWSAVGAAILVWGIFSRSAEVSAVRFVLLGKVSLRKVNFSRGVGFGNACLGSWLCVFCTQSRRQHGPLLTRCRSFRIIVPLY